MRKRQLVLAPERLCGGRYMLRATISRAYGGSTVQEVQLWVRNYEQHIEEVVPPIRVRQASCHRPCNCALALCNHQSCGW